MKQSIDTNHPAEQAYQIAKGAYKQVGKLRQENNTDLSFFGTSTYGLQAVKINISVESVGANSVIHIEATSDDVFEKGAKAMLQKIMPAIENSLNDSNTNKSESTPNISTTNTNHNSKAENTSAKTEGVIAKNQTIRFSTGQLIINDTNISFHQDRGNVNDVNTIGRENIGHSNKQSMRLLPNAEFVYIFRIALIGVALTVLGLVIGISVKNFSLVYLGVAAIAFAGFLMFSWLWIDGMLGIKLAEPILLKLFGVDAYRIVVQNIYGGNNLMFLIRDDEASKLPKFENYKLEKIHKVENVVSQNVNANSLDDLKKLGDLYQSGVLTKDEFDQKKTELLNK